MFRGKSHEESDGKGNTGIGITYGDNPVEVERGEPAIQLKDGSSGSNSLTVYGNLKIPNYGVEMLGDPKAKGKKFKNYVSDLTRVENSQNKIMEKSTKAIDSVSEFDPYDKLSFASYKSNMLGANMKLKDIADKKIKAANLQSAINDTAEEYGLIADDLAKGKVKVDKKAKAEQARFGKNILKAKDGVNEFIRPDDFSIDMSEVEMPTFKIDKQAGLREALKFYKDAPREFRPPNDFSIDTSGLPPLVSQEQGLKEALQFYKDKIAYFITMNENDEKVGDDEERIALLKKKVQIFFDKKINVHVTMNNKTFYNGELIQPVAPDYFMMIDRKLGELPVFFVQVRDIEPQEMK
jgi:hypothetical protein